MTTTSKSGQEQGTDASRELELFVNEILSNGQVWGLKEKTGDGWAVCDSIEFEETEVFPFWSSESAAALHCSDEWKIYQPEAIDLQEFLIEWLPGMHEDDTLVGTNWDAELSGEEIEPADLAARLGGVDSEKH
jgi:hypothetical protein